MRISQFSPFNLDNWREEPVKALLGAAVVVTGTALLGGRIATQLMSPGQKLFFFLSRRSSRPPQEVAAGMGDFFRRSFFDGIATCERSWIGSRGPVRRLVFGEEIRRTPVGVPVYGGVGDFWWKTLFTDCYGTRLSAANQFEIVTIENRLDQFWAAFCALGASGTNFSKLGRELTGREVGQAGWLKGCREIALSVRTRSAITTPDGRTYYHVSIEATDGSDILPLLAGHLRFVGAV